MARSMWNEEDRTSPSLLKGGHMKYLYTAVFSPKESGNGYYASVPDLPGCISTGRDLNDAIDQITDAASSWLVVA